MQEYSRLGASLVIFFKECNFKQIQIVLQHHYTWVEKCMDISEYVIGLS